MIFEPYEDELSVINRVHMHNENDYVLIRLTSTMIEKNNIDANGLFRDLLLSYGLVNYDVLDNGGRNGVKHDVKIIFSDEIAVTKMNFYRVNNNRSDPRFSIYGIKAMLQDGKIKVGDLLYISVAHSSSGNQLIIIDTTTNIPSSRELKNTFGIGVITDAVQRLLPEIKTIARAGYHPNSKGKGKVSPKDVGDTLEYLLGIKTNNSQGADYEGKIEIKAKKGKTLDTLFTLRPRFEGTPVELIEDSDRSRVSAFTRLYGYDSERHPGYNSLYITIGTKTACQNTLGFYLEVNEENRTVELRRQVNSRSHELTAYWTFDDLREELHRKHHATLWVKALQRMNNGIVEFKYYEAELSREPQFTTFLSMIESGGITYDWRGYTSQTGRYHGKNHGNAWRIKKRYRDLIFGSMEKIELV